MTGGRARSGAALSYTPEELWLMEAGHLDICFGEQKRQGKRERLVRSIGGGGWGVRCFLAYELVNA